MKLRILHVTACHPLRTPGQSTSPNMLLHVYLMTLPPWSLLQAILGVYQMGYKTPATASPTVQLGQTALVGAAYGDQEFFGNIPFTEAPTGSLRFAPPIAKVPPHIPSTFDASAAGLPCLQIVSNWWSNLPGFSYLPTDNADHWVHRGLSHHQCAETHWSKL